MKKLTTLMVFIIIATAAQAQFKKGTYFFSGDLSANYKSETLKADGSDGKSETKEVALSGSVGYFMKKNIAVGGNISYASVDLEGDDSDSSLTELRAFARYYFGTPKLSSFIPYVQGNLGYATAKEGNKDHGKYSGTLFGGVAGFNYFLTRNIGFDIGAQYEMGKMENAKNSKSKFDVTRFVIKAGIIITLDF